MAKNNSLMKAGFWQLLNVFLLVVIQLSYYGYLARILSKKDFGVIAIATVFLNLAILLSESGLGPALIQRKEITKGHISAALFTNILVAAFFFFIMLLSANAIGKYFDSEVLGAVLKVLSINFILQAMGSVSNNLLMKYMKFKFIFIAEVGANFFSSIIGVILVLKGFDIWALVYSMVILTGTRSLLFIFFNRKNVVRFGKFTKQDFHDLYAFGMGLTLVRLNNYLNTFGFQFMVGKLVPLSVLGVFERSYRIMIQPGNSLGKVIDKVMFPGMARVNDDDELLFKYYERLLELVNILMIPTAALCILFTNEIVAVMLGPKWKEAVPALRLLFASMPFMISVRMCDSVIRAKGRVLDSAKRKFYFTLILFITVFLACIVFKNDNLKLYAVCGAVTISTIFNYFNMVGLVKKIFSANISVYFKPFSTAFKMMFAALAICLPIYYVSDYFITIKFLPFLLSISIIILAVVYTYRFHSKAFGETLNWFFNRLNLPYRKGIASLK